MKGLSAPIIWEGLRLASHSIKRKAAGWKRYNGDAKEICRQIVADCWNGRFFQASAGHFRQFYARDFGISAGALIDLGYNEECKKTLQYALERYSQFGRITTAITPSGRPFDFPNAYSPDSVAWIFKCLELIRDKTIVEQHHAFLQKEIDRFFEQAVDPMTGLAKRNTHLGGMKDYAVRDSSCYDSAMISFLSQTVKKMKVFSNPFKSYNHKKEIISTYWREDHFTDDLSGRDFVSADANVVPFALGIIDNKAMIKKAVSSIQQAGLDNPFPLRYEPRGACTKQIWFEPIVPSWERSAHWANITLYYIELLSQVDEQAYQKAVSDYKQLIERHGTLFECYDYKGEPYRSWFYHADEGMVWGAGLVKRV